MTETRQLNPKERKTPNVGELQQKVNSMVPAKEPNKLPTLAELFNDSIELIGKTEGLNTILNTPPPDSWVKTHPYIKDHKYLPIDKVEYLLRKIFKKYSIEITGQGTAFNGVWVTVRVGYRNPVDGEMEYQDGIGAIQLQTAKGASPADLANINNGALSMAFPLAKTLAVKDACDMIGNIFGANLNRRDAIQFTPDVVIAEKYHKAFES